MRQPRILLAASFALTFLAGAGAAGAQGKDGPTRVAGTYSVKFDQVANNCAKAGMSLSSSTVDVSQPKERTVSVTIPSVPIMGGSVSRGGKFRAGAKRGKTAIQGVDGRFSVAGRVEKGTIQFLFIAEYFEGDKPLCTQSWNASGPRR
jgi:hypothetical protein